MTFKSPVSMSARPAEHQICVASPSSENAKQLGYEKTGCFTIEVAGKMSPARSYAQAKSFVEKLGSTPGRWSMDHPSNQRLNPHHDISVVSGHH